jgi:hypothetical protein
MCVRFVALPSCRRARSSGFSAGGQQLQPDRFFGAGTYEVDTDGGDVGLCVGVVGEPQEQARLADTRVTDEQQLEEVVVSGILLVVGTGRKARSGYREDRRSWQREGTLEESESVSRSKQRQKKRAAGSGQQAPGRTAEGDDILLGIHDGRFVVVLR